MIDTSSTPSIVFNLLSILAAQFAQSRPSRIYIFVFDTPFTFLFFGTSNNIPEVMQIFDVFILPSLYEGLPVVEIEAQAAGVRSIVSNKVTKEIDLGIGLVDFAGIDDENINEWIELLGKPNEELDYEKINEALEKNGYNVQSTVKSFYELYSGE